MNVEDPWLQEKKEIKPSWIIYVVTVFYGFLSVGVSVAAGGVAGGGLIQAFIFYWISKAIWKSDWLKVENNHLKTLAACGVGFVIYSVITAIFVIVVLGI